MFLEFKETLNNTSRTGSVHTPGFLCRWVNCLVPWTKAGSPSCRASAHFVKLNSLTPSVLLCCLVVVLPWDSSGRNWEPYGVLEIETKLTTCRLRAALLSLPQCFFKFQIQRSGKVCPFLSLW